MTDIKNTPYLIKLIKKTKEDVYESEFRYIKNADSRSDIKEAYEKFLGTKYRAEGIDGYTDDYSFPSEQFMEKVDKKYREDKEKILKLFKNAGCISFSNDFMLDNDSGPLVDWRYDARKRGNILVYSKSIIPVEDQHLLALFSDGTCLFNNDLKETKDEMLNDLRRVAGDKGYKVNEPEFVEGTFINKINSYARMVNKDGIEEVSNPTKDELATKKPREDNLKASADVADKFVFFSDGSIVIPERYSYSKNKKTHSKIRDFIREIYKKVVVLRPLYVPDETFEALIGKKLDDTVTSEVIDTKEMSAKNAINAKRGVSKKEKKSEGFLGIDYENNRCLTVKDVDDLIKSERSLFALFEDGTFLVNEEKHYVAGVSEFEAVIKRVWPNIVINKKMVSEDDLKKVYEEVFKHQKTCAEIFSEMLKKRAKKMVKAEGIPHHEALEKVARRNDFNNWKEVCEIDEVFAKNCIAREQKRRLYIDVFMMNPKGYAKQHNMSFEEAENAIGKLYGFKDWDDLENASYIEIMEAADRRRTRG